MLDLLHSSALEQAQAIRRGDVSSEELTRFYLRRIDRLNPQLQAFSQVLHRRAILSARYKDLQRRRVAADELPSLHGVPIGIKDLVPVRGTMTRLGSRTYRYFLSPIDAPISKRIKRGGLVVVGKLTTSEFGAMPITEPEVHAPTRNPFDERHTSGGSSGGSGTAVASGMVPFAHGSDGAGSVRIPAAFCHLYGFKPTLGLLGNLHGKVNKLGMSVMGPLAHTVEDAAALLDVFKDDPFPGEHPESCLAAARREPGKMKILVLTHSAVGDVDPAIAEAVHATAKQLEALGHTVVETPSIAGDIDEFLPIWFFNLAAVPSPTDRYLQPVTRWLRARGKGLRYEDIRPRRDALAARVLESFGDADALISPTVGLYPPPVGSVRQLDPEEAFRKIAPIGAFTAVFNLTDQPAASVPGGVSPEGLPFGIQLVGRRGEDRRVLALSRQLEQAMPWRDRNVVSPSP